MNMYALIWIGIMLFFLIVEGIVPGLISIWFALGALVAVIPAAFHAPLWLQALTFVVASTVALALTRPFAQKYVNGRVQPTNADVLIGKECIVEERIDNISGTGAVIAAGKVWTARMEDDSEKAVEGQRMTVVRIDGVKLIVRHREA